MSLHKIVKPILWSDVDKRMKSLSWIKGLIGVLLLIVATTATSFAQTSDKKEQSTTAAQEIEPKKKPELIIPDSLRAVYKYTEGLKQLNIFGDTTASQKLLREALEIDSTYAPALYEWASQFMEGGKNDDVAIALARKA